MTEEGNPFIPEQVSKRQMRLMLDAIPARIWFLDREHRVRFANREAAALFDLEPGEIVGRSAASLTGQESFDSDNSFRDKALSGSVVTWEGWSVYPDGEERYTQRTFSPHFDRGDKVDGYYEFVRDITDQKRAERQRSRSLELLNDAIESLSEGFALFDAEDRLVTCNSRFLELNAPHQGVFEPGVTWLDAARARAEKGFFPDADGQVDAWLEERLRRRKEASDDEIALVGGRWVEVSHRRTRQGGLVHTWRDITARKEMERALRESAQMVRQILEACPFALVMARVRDRRILYESPANNVMFGEAQENKAKYIGEYDVNPSQRDEYMKRLKRDGYVNDFEMGFKGLDGREFFSALSGRLIEYDGEEVIVSGAVDLTERKAMENALRESEALVRQVLEACPLPVRMWDPESGQVLYESPACRNLFGRDATKVSPEERMSAYVDLRDRERYCDELLRNKSVDNMEIRLRRFDGSVFWASVSARVIEFRGQKVVVSTIVDLSERKEMELALRESERMVRQVLEACPVPITMNRIEDGVVIYESPAAQQLMRFPKSQEGESVISRWVDPRDRRSYLKRLIREGAVDRLEIRFKKADGEEFPCALSSRLVDYQGEQVIVSNLFDLTEIKEAEDELSRQREMLHESEKLSALGELLAGVSHELNNPLSVLVGQALMLKEEAGDEKSAARAEMIGKAADRCARIVKSFLAMARQEPTQLEPVDLGAIIDSALEVTAYSLRSSGIEVSLRMAKNLPMVMADPDQMRQVLTNLIINARDALQEVAEPRRLRITTSFRQQSQEVVVKVRDNGPGVPPQIRSRIFEPLFTTKEVGSGTGVGLSLCHRIIEAHNGSISTERASSEGAIFAIRLPPAKKGTRGVASKRPGSSKTTECRTLVVEDDSDVGQIIAEVLEHDGHTVDLVASGSIALQKIRRRTYDVVLSDVRMPGMDGPSFCRALAKVRPEQLSTLAFITGDTLSPKVREFLDASERPYLEKPITPEDLRELVDLLIRRKAI